MWALRLPTKVQSLGHPVGTSFLLGFGLGSSWGGVGSPKADRPGGGVEKVIVEERSFPGLLLGSEGELWVHIPPLGPLPSPAPPGKLR